MLRIGEPRSESGTIGRDRRGTGRSRRLGLLACLLAGWAGSSRAADLDGARALLQTGHYDECIEQAEAELRGGYWVEPWSLLKIEAERARGRYAEALATLEDGLQRIPWSLRLRLVGRDIYRLNGREGDARAALDRIETLIVSGPQRYGSPEDRVDLGRFFLLRGADPRKILDQFFDVAIRQEPGLADAYLATAELALSKQDGALAAETLAKVQGEAAEDPGFLYLRALAFEDDDRARSEESLARALEINPSHADSLLLRADHLIDSEQYAEASTLLDRALGVNPREPRAWAYRAVLAHLRSDPEAEAEARTKALTPWASNPEVDHIIGRELSQKYRFAEGSARQRQALELDSDHLPARVQLCQDLLRLGLEDEGWALADEIFGLDAYNVVAYNLATLRDHLEGFRTLRTDGIVVRMDPREADLYGDRVLALLARARETLCDRYGADVPDPVTVEIFPQKKDFAVRTFALPGADGLLGVCFGRVITANSPASQGETPANWEAVLWHEFCHAVTLTKTRNKMPRWLSEGISVYEEQREQAAWGTPLDPRFRAMILGDDLSPLSQLSAAFLAPESGLHLQFAYFESALAVEFLVDRFGMPALNGLLDDLGAGKTINEALPGRTEMTLTQLDEEFVRFARRKAEAVAPEATWEEPELPAGADAASIEAWLADHPKAFWGWRRLGARLVAEGRWEDALEALETFKGLDPGYVGADNAYMLLAAAHRGLSDAESERQALEDLAARDGDAVEAYLRLMELDEAEGRWDDLARDANRLLAVNPLIPAPHRRLARAAEHLDRLDEAIGAYRALARLDPTDPAEVHFRLASLLLRDGRPDEARREVLKSLEEAPRFLDAHRLLLELVDPPDSRPTEPPAEATTR